MATIEDVAKAAGIHRSAVSHTFSGKGNLSAETRERILQCAQELGYRPNLIARSLSKRRTHTIGLTVPDITNPYYATAVQVVEQTAYRSGYRAIIAATDRNKDLGYDLLCDLVDRRVDGIVLTFDTLSAATIQSITATIPVVWCMWETAGSDLTPAVTFDFAHAGQLVAEHLLALGHTRIALVADARDEMTYEGRCAGFRRALQSAGYPLADDLLRIGDGTLEGGRTAAGPLFALSDSPTAVFATNDLMALGLLERARERGLRVPDDLSIVGFDDIFVANLVTPALTTVHIDSARIMSTATELLIALIGGQPASSPPPFQPRLIVRASSGPPPSSRPPRLGRAKRSATGL